jgi:23S rRNA (uracil-5-)-methyltransferase RumA
MAEPLCKYFGKCGGCSLQHIDYSTQLENKRKQLSNLLGVADIPVFSAEPYHYRNRMDFMFHEYGIGLREKGKWFHVLDVDECFIANSKINKLMIDVKEFFDHVDVFDIDRQTGTFRYAVIRAPGDSSCITIAMNEDSAQLGPATELIKQFAKRTKADNVTITHVPRNSDQSTAENHFAVKGTDLLDKSYLGKNFVFPVEGFFQNNDALAEKMHDYVRNMLKQYDTKKTHLLDLYGGVGTFGIINSDLFTSVFIVESFKCAIDSAKLNIKRNNASNCNPVVLNAKNLRKLRLPQPLYVITDPPRSGMDQRTIDQLKFLKPELIIYISCNPQQLAKDVLKFKEYEIKSAALFDLFPQTHHMEAVVELRKKQSS